ncbi:glycosyltransferase [Dyadobacter luteus]|uniref:Glycosyltransferase n=1 Tax=Dyadobacter luteus TaxID=2259619 RepID=A0A3D8YEM4_9BACT|nr:glycosyltransferase family 2 protein [Dyadobacter luteus]REA63043.1 glycosyltransferase [Dyadobacter luteus]
MRADYPKITIVTASFNQGKYLEDTILSVLSQGYPNLEYIIIDGGSTDESVHIIKKYEHQLSYWVSESDNGLYYAIQKGFKRSTGDIMAWLNADDLLHRKSLFQVANIFAKYADIKWIMGSNTYFDESGFPFVFEAQPYAQRWSRKRLLLGDGYFVQQESVFWRRELWSQAGGQLSESFSLAADLELWLRFSRYAKLYSTSYMLAGFRLRSENQKSYTQRDEYLDQVQQLLEEERRRADGIRYVFVYKLLLNCFRLLPKRKWQDRLSAGLLALPPKIVFDRTNVLMLSYNPS